VDRSTERPLLDAAQFAPLEKKLGLCALVLERIEANPEKQANSHLNRSALRKLRSANVSASLGKI
jgi:hypothetical protein